MAKSKRTFDLIALASIPFIMVLGNSMLIPILPQIQQNLNITQMQVSLIITVFSISAAGVIPLSGYLSDRFGRKKIIIPSLILFGSGGIVAGLAAWFLTDLSAYWTMIAGRTIQGIGAAGTAPITMALVGDIFKGGAQSKSLGIIEATNGLGKVASPILGTLFAFIIWFAPFFAFPVLCLISLIALMLFVKEPPPTQKPPPFKKYVDSVVEVFQKDGRWLIAMFFVGTIALFVLFGLLFYLSDILESTYQMTGLNKGYILAVPLLFMVTTVYITGRLIKKNFPLMKSLIISGMLLMAGALIPMMFVQNLYLLIGLLALIGLGAGLAIPCINSFITGSVDTAKRGMITSLYGSVRFGGVALGPPAFGYLMTTKDWILFGSNAALVLLAALWALVAIQVEGGRSGGNGQKEQTETGEEERTFSWKKVTF